MKDWQFRALCYILRAIFYSLQTGPTGNVSWQIKARKYFSKAEEYVQDHDDNYMIE